MIRVFLFSEAAVPASLISLLKATSEVELLHEPTSSDLVLFSTAVWNRAALSKMKQLLNQGSKLVVIVCQQADVRFATESILRKEVSAVILLSSTGEQMIASLRAAASGLKVLPEFTNGKHDLIETTPLTPRELEVLSLIAEGEGNKSIAYLLEISEHTVKFHISSIFEKLNVSSRTEAVKAGITRGLIAI
jgi:NarL family two-component system response regulator YdfI